MYINDLPDCTSHSSTTILIADNTILYRRITSVADNADLQHDLDALNGLTPQYLVDDCQLITTTGRRRLGSSNVATYDVPRTRTTLGDRSFTAAGPHRWNNLPLHLRDFELSPSEFRRLLKTHLFG